MDFGTYARTQRSSLEDFNNTPTSSIHSALSTPPPSPMQFLQSETAHLSVDDQTSLYDATPSFTAPAPTRIRQGSIDSQGMPVRCLRSRVLFICGALVCGAVVLVLVALVFPQHDSDKLLGNKMVAMQDGTRLATDVYLPAGRNSAFPAILVRGRARKEDHIDGIHVRKLAKVFNNQGFVFVVQELRGFGQSEGTTTTIEQDGRDGYDTIHWIVKHKWSNRLVGTMGSLYSADIQLATGCLTPEPLAAMFVISGGLSNAFEFGTRRSGVFDLTQAMQTFELTKQSKQATQNRTIQEELKQIKVKEYFHPSDLPWNATHNPVMLDDYEERLLSDWRSATFGSHWNTTARYNKQCYQKLARVPTAFVTGHFDSSASSVIENFAGWRMQKGEAMLVIGPWRAIQWNLTSAGDVDFGSEATFEEGVGTTLGEIQLAWFAKHLKGTEGELPDVSVFAMGGGNGQRNHSTGKVNHGGRWLKGKHYPPLPGWGQEMFVLSENRTLEVLTSHHFGNDAKLGFIYDPMNPVPTVGGAFSSQEDFLLAGSFDQITDRRFFPSQPPFEALDLRQDVISFETEVLEEAITLAGVPRVVLWVSSNCSDTDFVAKLVDVHPSGFANNIADGIFRMRYRDNQWSHPQQITPGHVYQAEILLDPTANQFDRGHRIRLDITSSNFPHYDLSHNIFTKDGENDRSWQVAHNLIHFGKTTPSRVILPIKRG